MENNPSNTIIDMVESESSANINTPNLHIDTADLSNELNGVKWNGNKEEKRSFLSAFTEVLKTCDLTGRSKLIIRSRFLKLYNHYKDKCKNMKWLNMSSRIVVSFGSIIIPALISLDNDHGDRSEFSQAIYYITFSLSLTISLTNALSELFQFNKKMYTYTVVKESMKTEGWLFLTLSGNYKEYNDHSECWRKFMNRVEKLNTNTIHTDLVINSNSNEDVIRKDKLKFPMDTDSEISKTLYLSP